MGQAKVWANVLRGDVRICPTGAKRPDGGRQPETSIRATGCRKNAKSTIFGDQSAPTVLGSPKGNFENMFYVYLKPLGF